MFLMVNETSFLNDFNINMLAKNRLFTDERQCAVFRILTLSRALHTVGVIFKIEFFKEWQVKF